MQFSHCVNLLGAMRLLVFTGTVGNLLLKFSLSLRKESSFYLSFLKLLRCLYSRIHQMWELSTHHFFNVLPAPSLPLFLLGLTQCVCMWVCFWPMDSLGTCHFSLIFSSFSSLSIFTVLLISSSSFILSHFCLNLLWISLGSFSFQLYFSIPEFLF